MPSQRLSQTAQKLDFGEKLLQTGKKENSDALLRRLKVSVAASSPSSGGSGAVHVSQEDSEQVGDADLRFP